MDTTPAQKPATSESIRASKKGRRGLLIDLDNALKLDTTAHEQSIGDQTVRQVLLDLLLMYLILTLIQGTVRFMAFQLLSKASPPLHTFAHDLQSFLWVILRICHKFAGPDQTSRMRHGQMPWELHRDWYNWDQVDSYPLRLVAARKSSIMENPSVFEVFLKETFSAYFEDFKPLVRELRVAIIDQEEKLSHAVVLSIIRRYKEVLPLRDT